MEQKENGAIVFHIVLMLYMFTGLAMICDEFFEPSLDAICVHLGLSEDVAGATFMAAGSSAPEFFTSVMGVFFAESDVGIGTIVGSAVFNILIIIGLCALVAPNVSLSWWPLTRDVLFYCLSIIALVVFIVIDNRITIEESIICVVLYALYVTVMYYNRRLEKFVTGLASAAVKGTRAPWRLALTNIIHGVPFNLLISLCILANLGVVVWEFTAGEGSPLAVTLNYVFSAIFIAEMVIKLTALGFFLYWQDPSNAFDGILVLLIMGEYALSGSAKSSSVRTFRLFKILRVVRGLRCLKLYFSAVSALRDGSIKGNKVAAAEEAAELYRVEKTNGDTDQEAEKEAGEKDGEGEGGDDDDDDDDDPFNPFEVPQRLLCTNECLRQHAAHACPTRMQRPLSSPYSTLVFHDPIFPFCTIDSRFFVQ